MIRQKIFYGIVAAVCCGLLAFGCAKENTATPAGELHNATVQLSIGSKAVSESDGKPAAAESEIHTLRVYAFAGDRLAGHYYIDKVSVVPHNFYMDIAFYSMKQDVDFYVIANEDAMETPGSAEKLSEHTAKKQLDDFTFTKFRDTGKYGLPMFSKRKRQLDFESLLEQTPDGEHVGHQLNDTTLFHLRRPMGKLGVFAAKREGDAGELRITGLTMLASGTRTLNYLMPQTDETLKNVSGISGDFPLAVTDASVDKELADNITPEERQNPANYTPVLAAPFYPFENPWGSDAWNIKGDEHGNVLRIDYSIDGAARSGLVYLPRIVRNTYYTVCCLINNEGKISVEYTVADWDTKDKYELEFDYPTYDNPIIPWGDSDTGQQFGLPTVWYNHDSDSKEGSYSFSFKITGSVGQTWKPTFFRGPGNLNVTVWQNDQLVSPDKDGSYGVSPEAYELRVKAVEPNAFDENDKPKTAELGISYTPLWDPSGSSLLLINGLTGHLRWEGSEYAETILIKQVEMPTN